MASALYSVRAWWLGGLVGLSLVGPAGGWAMEDQAAVESARRALSGRRSFPWYDPVGDGLRAQPLEPQAAPPSPRQWSQGRRWRAPQWGNWGTFWDLVKYTVWLLLAALMAWLVYIFARVYWQREDREVQLDRQRMRHLQNDAERIERLPFDLTAKTIDLRAEAQQAYQREDFERAIVYLFSYLLIELDRAHRIRLSRGKTNRQYLAELRRQGELHGIVEAAMVAFEDVFFGRRALGRERFEACWSRLPVFRQLTEQPVETAGSTP